MTPRAFRRFTSYCLPVLRNSIPTSTVSCSITLGKPVTLAAFCAGILLLSACGGGGGGGTGNAFGNASSQASNGWQLGVFKPASDFKNKCALPRTGVSPITGSAYPDIQGTSLDEKNWLRSWSNETYLWYNEIADINPNNSSTPVDYFANLKTMALTANGTLKDKYHYTTPTAEDEARYVAGQEFGYGLGVFGYAWSAPRDVRIAYTEPGSPAALAGVKRGSKILKMDGVDFVNDGTQAGVDILNEALFPSAVNQMHSMEVQEPGSDTTKVFNLQSAAVTTSPVLLSKIIATANGNVGYLLFNSHIQTAEAQMADAINNFKANGVQDLVLDLRYNGGGQLDIAAEVGYMIAGTKAESKDFYKFHFNNKSPSYAPIPFVSVGNYGVTANTKLPSLELNRVFVLSSAQTCSASEAIINGLRGIDVEVVLLGGQTCGKPYGFLPEDNCGTTYSTINFSGTNAKNFGDYSDGFIPTGADNGADRVKGCDISDDFTRALGDPAEQQLAAALSYRTTGSCPTVLAQSSSLVRKKLAADVAPGLALSPHYLQDAVIFSK